MTTAAPQLDYAPPRRRRRWGRYLSVLLLLAAAGAGVYFHKPVWRRAKLVYWERRCMTYQRPAGAVTHEADPIKAAALLAAGGDYIRSSDGTGAVLQPQCWRKLDAALNRLVRLQDRMVLAGPIADPATVFLHQRRSPGGTVRLVHVQARGQLNIFALAGEMATDYVAITPGGLLSDPTYRGVQQAFAYSGRLIPATVSYGAVDPVDPSHFTIPYASELGNGTIDAWLQDDGQVRFQVRDGPGKR